MGKKKQLSIQQKTTLLKHSAHHTPAHMAYMRQAMASGKTFTQAHKEAMKQVGK
tara:strand:+ start:160 stop:321 length:162 start_codon:yes stop_codon:yes gene_type:complete